MLPAQQCILEVLLQPVQLPPVNTSAGHDSITCIYMNPSLCCPPLHALWSVLPAGDGASSAADGSEAGGYQSDFKRGRRLRKLARMLNGKQAQKVQHPDTCGYVQYA